MLTPIPNSQTFEPHMGSSLDEGPYFIREPYYIEDPKRDPTLENYPHNALDPARDPKP